MATSRESNAGQPTGVRISSDRSEIDLDWVHRALSERAYWALGRTRDEVVASIEASTCFSAFEGNRQIGFARVISDGVTFAWICDVFVDEPARGRGVGRRLVEAIVADPRLGGVRRMVLSSRDAGGLYSRSGFSPLASPERWMERRAPRRPPGVGPGRAGPR